MKERILLIVLLLIVTTTTYCQPDTNKAYISKSRPLTAIRFGNGWYKTYRYEATHPKMPKYPAEILDSGTYTVGKWTITFFSKVSHTPTIKRIKGTDIYGKLFTSKSKWRTALTHLYPTKEEYKFEEWKDANWEKFMTERKEAVRKKTEPYIKKYCPKYQVIIDSCFCGPGCYYSIINGRTMHWDGDISKVNLPDEINTIVHESTHHYNESIFKYEEGKFIHRHRYMIEPGITIITDVGPNYKTSDFLPILPKDAPNSIFRYNTYVSPSSDVSANLSGIYGLLDEFSAYYNGTKASWDGYLTSKSMGLTKESDIFRTHAFSTHNAFYEFRAFIGWYLQFAKMKHPEMYADMMNNENLKRIFRELDTRFKKLLTDMNATEDYYLVPHIKKIEPYLEEFSKEVKKEVKEVKKVKPIQKKKRK